MKTVTVSLNTIDKVKEFMLLMQNQSWEFSVSIFQNRLI